MKRRAGVLWGLCLALLPTAALANSSWRWFTKTRPHDLLPLAIVWTVAIEIFALCRFGGVKSKKRAAGSVVIANLISFLVPWALEYHDFFYEQWNFSMGFDAFLSKTPHYQVTALFLLMTLLAEIPAVYLLVKKHVPDKKRLLLTVVCMNTATTAVCAVIERVLCRGQW